MSTTGRPRTDVFFAPKTDRASLLSAEDRGGYRIGAGRGRARMIVADGAGTAHLSGLLAELIVTSFLDERFDGGPFAPGDTAAYHEWHLQINEQWKALAESETGEQWYAKMNLDRGSAAAFAAAVIDGEHCWCLAVGDCCLFQIRHDPEPTCVGSFPIESWPSFNSSPELVRTVLDDISWPAWARLELRPGDLVVGASDGVAEWVLAAAVQNAEVWRLLAEMSAADFDGLVTGERLAGRMVDDDCVVVRLDPGAGR